MSRALVMNPRSWSCTLDASELAKSFNMKLGERKGRKQRSSQYQRRSCRFDSGNGNGQIRAESQECGSGWYYASPTVSELNENIGSCDEAILTYVAL